MKDLIEAGLAVLIALAIVVLAVVLEFLLWIGVGFVVAYIGNIILAFFNGPQMIWWHVSLALWGVNCFSRAVSSWKASA